MFGSKILPAILIMVPATVLVSTQASLSEPAAEECKASPGTNTPRGAHWYYHVNRAKQHCWYLGVVDAHANKAAVTPAASAPAPTRQKSNIAEPALADAAPAVPAATALAPVAPAVAVPAAVAAAPALPQPQRGPEFMTRWPDNLPNADDLDQQEPAAVGSSYADAREATEKAPQMPSKSPLAQSDGTLTATAGEAALRYVSIAGALAIPLLLAAGWAAKFSRRPRRLADQGRAIAARLRPRRHVDAAPLIGLAPLVADPHGDIDWQPPTPTDPAYDLKTSLAELMRDLRRAGAFEPAPAADEPHDQTEAEDYYPSLHAADEPHDQRADQPHDQTATEDYYPPLQAADEPRDQRAGELRDQTEAEDYSPSLQAAGEPHDQRADQLHDQIEAEDYSPSLQAAGEPHDQRADQLHDQTATEDYYPVRQAAEEPHDRRAGEPHDHTATEDYYPVLQAAE